MNRLEQKIRQASKENRYAVIPFLTACYPDRKKFWETLHELDSAGADVIEIGVPFSDPVADGPVVENASRKALENGVNLEEILKELAQRKGQFQAGLVLMGYYNPFLQYGLEKLVEDAAACGVDGFIVPDLPWEESGLLRNILANKGLCLIPLVGPNTSAERMKLYAQDAKGYVYVVSVMGTTGERSVIQSQIADVLAMAKKLFQVPVALGFGLKNPAQLENLLEKPDAAVFGSALLKHIEQGKDVAEFMEAWR